MQIVGKGSRKVSRMCYQAAVHSLAQTEYLYRLNAALKILYFVLLRDHKLIESSCSSLVFSR